jgi:hypothetical protein
MECNRSGVEIIDLDKFNELINEYNDENDGEFIDFLTKCPTTGGAMKGGAPGDTKLNKYFLMILRCLVYSIVTENILRELVLGIPQALILLISIGFIKLLKMLLIGECQTQIPIINEMCPMYKDLFIEFLNNLEIILIKLGRTLSYGISKLIDLSSIRDIYNDSKIFYYLLNNPEFIDDVEYPVGTVFIVNKNKYPVNFVQQINTAINGDKQKKFFGTVTEDTSHIKNIPPHIQKMTYLRRLKTINEEIFITSNQEEIYLHPVYTRFYINIGYLSVDYISKDEAKNEITKYLKGREEMGKILELLELKYNIPESSMRSIATSLGETYRTSLIKNYTKNKPPDSSYGGKKMTKNRKQSKNRKQKTNKQKAKKQSKSKKQHRN